MNRKCIETKLILERKTKSQRPGHFQLTPARRKLILTQQNIEIKSNLIRTYEIG